MWTIITLNTQAKHNISNIRELNKTKQQKSNLISNINQMIEQVDND